MKSQGVAVYHGSDKVFTNTDDINFKEGFYTLKRTEEDIAEQIEYLKEPYNNRITKLSLIKEEKLLTKKEIEEFEKILADSSGDKKMDKRFKELADKAGRQSRINSGITLEKELEEYLQDPARAFGGKVNKFIVNFKKPLVVDFNGKG